MNLRSALDGKSFASRFALAAMGRVAVCLDLETGNFFKLNEAALQVCSALIRGEGVEATSDVLTLVHELSREYPPRGRSPLRFELLSGNWVMSWSGSAILEIDESIRQLRWIGERNPSDIKLKAWLRVALPPLLIHFGQPILHASAVLVNGGVLMFSGPSGAGKTTCASVFRETGATFVSGDLVVLSLGTSSLLAYEDGEARIDTWVAAAARELSLSGECRLELADVAGSFRGPTHPVREIWFLDQHRRHGSQLLADRLSSADALGLILDNSFAEFEQRRTWMNAFSLSRKVAEAVTSARVTLPDGLNVLRSAILAQRIAAIPL